MEPAATPSKSPGSKSSKKRKSLSSKDVTEDNTTQSEMQIDEPVTEEVEKDGGAEEPSKKKSKKKSKSKSKEKKGEDAENETTATSMIIDESGDSRFRINFDALSPIAHPLADKKLEKRVLKTVKKAAKLRLIKRGVKAVVKALRKGEKGLVIMAGNISPIDILTHIPLLAEENGSGYIFVPTKESLGIASCTKRPTSCVMITSAESATDAIKKKQAAKKESLAASDPSKLEKLKTEEEDYSNTYKATLTDVLQLNEKISY